jgi:hypothetical protein
MTSIPTSRLFGEKLEASWLDEQGLKIEFWDLSRLFFSVDKSAKFFGGAPDYAFVGPRHRHIESQSEFLELLDGLSDNVRGWYLSRFHRAISDDWVLLALQQKGVNYYLQHFDTLIRPAEMIVRFRSTIRACKQKIINRHLHPKGVVGSGRLGRKQSQFMFPSASFISVPSIKVLWSEAEPIIRGRFNLFVDESVDYAPDAKLFGTIICTDPDAYYKRLNILFDRIEGWSGVPVVIAASGKYRYSKDRFPGRQLVYGETLKLIQHADLVIGHMSLALDQCIASTKPLLVVDDPDFTQAKRSGFAVSLANLVISPISIMDVTRKIYVDALSVNAQRMSRLTCDYLKESHVVAGYRSIILEEFTHGLNVEMP